MSLASPLQLSLLEHPCSNGVKEEVVGEGISGDNPMEAEDGGNGGGGISNSSNKECLTPASSGVTCTKTAAPARRVKWNGEDPLVVSDVPPATAEDGILQEQLEVAEERVDGEQVNKQLRALSCVYNITLQ